MWQAPYLLAYRYAAATARLIRAKFAERHRCSCDRPCRHPTLVSRCDTTWRDVGPRPAGRFIDPREGWARDRLVLCTRHGTPSLSFLSSASNHPPLPSPARSEHLRRRQLPCNVWGGGAEGRGALQPAVPDPFQKCSLSGYAALCLLFGSCDTTRGTSG